MFEICSKVLHNFNKLNNLCEWLQSTPKCSIVLIYLAILVDNLLLTAVVPVIPDYLNKLMISSNDSSVEVMPLIESLFETNVTKANNMSLIYKNMITINSNALFDDENGKIGFLLSTKAFVQLICNFFVSSVIKRFGYEMTQIFGSFVLFLSALLYSMGQSFTMFLIPRCIQGIASALITVSGMAMIANMFSSQESRTSIMGFILGGMAIGVLVGYPFGGFTYEFWGKSAPFIIIAFICLLLMMCQMVTFNWSLSNGNTGYDIPFRKLLSDKYIVVSIGLIGISTTSMSILESCLPLWLIENMKPTPEKWQLGTVFIPDSIGYLIGTNFMISSLSLKTERWITAMSSLALVGVSAIAIPMATNINHLIFPHFGLGLGIGTIDAAIMPFLANVVDSKFFTLYGSVYAIAQTAVCLAYSLGPLISGQLIKMGVEFSLLIRIVGLMNLMYCPICLVLRNIEINDLMDEKTNIIDENNIQTDYLTIESNVGKFVPFINED